MTIRNLEGFFAPNSVTVIGPSRHEAVVLDRLLHSLSAAREKHSIHLVDLPATGEWQSNVVSSIDDIPAPDLAICLGPADNSPDTISTLGARGTRAVLLLSPRFESWPEELLQRCREAAKPNNLRIIGPGSLGFSVPGLSLNPLLSAAAPLPGDIAFFARSSAVLNATLSWAANHKIGFSAAVSLGARMDVDIGDLIDYFTRDYRTHAIVLHLDNLSDPQKFISAARAASKSKPVIIIRSGKSLDVHGTGLTHAGRLANADLVYEAVFRRAGLLRVDDLDEMFEAVETLSRIRVPKCETLAIVTNSRSMAMLAADHLIDSGGHLAELNSDTATGLAPFCRQTPEIAAMSGARGQIVLKEDLSADELRIALNHILKDTGVDGILTLHTATAFTPLASIAETIAATAQTNSRGTKRTKAIVAGLVGGNSSDRAPLDAARIPCYSTPAEAVRGVMHLTRDARAREFLMAVPPSVPQDFLPDRKAARDMISKVLANGRTWLEPMEVAALFAAYQIPLIGTAMAETPEEAAESAKPFFEKARYCVVKLISPDLPFKSQIDGLRLGLESPAEIAAAARELLDQTRGLFPAARISGISVHPMMEDRHGVELFTGLANTPVLGPVMVFGQGGSIVEESADISLELPPLDLKLAHALIDRTRVSRILDGSRARPQLNRDAVALTLVKLSQICIDNPEIVELDINPLVARQSDVIALDGRVTLEPRANEGNRRKRSRLVITPYPSEWEQTLTLRDGKPVFVRPVRPEDEEIFLTFFEAVSQEDLRLRFFAPVRAFSHRFLAQLTQLDYARAIAFAAIDPDTGTLLGAVRLHTDPDHETGEYAVLVRSDLKGVGLGWALMQLIIRFAKEDGLKMITGEVLKENTSMLSMCQKLGFKVRTSPEDIGIANVSLSVADAPDG